MTASFEIFTIGAGFGYRISIGGQACLEQTYKPDAEGFESMTEDQATEYASAICSRLNAVETAEPAPV